ncbi:LysR family transcriptional regulator [Candidimonas sp. SYP-B2681]|uniref:LysR family transcriptional regulator n=1 Tax=Candidimonas sp. SYP-B2681 TaxID=2497686 RepID=UPI000F87D9FC|nr:LysR family transcriptional regulator [Candidimonas sp. SYP-B2681]RTZ43202.1 LysR family transcriptional regulator [Candidimonas sp. SYP-B2681]
MELRQLRYFLAVAQELHFGRAAERAHIAQSPLSRQIKQLEDDLGVVLFDRTKHRVELSSAGRALIPEAKAILAATEQARRSVVNAEAGIVGRLTIGFTNSVIYTALPKILVAYRNQFPNVELTLRDSLLTPMQISALMDKQLDLGFLRPPIMGSDLDLLTVARERLVVALPSGHRLTARSRIKLEDLAEDQFIVFARTLGSALPTMILRVCHDAGFHPRIVQEAGDISTMIMLVSAGMGVSLVPSSWRNMRLKGVVFRQIAGGGPMLELALAWNRTTESAARDQFINVAKEVLISSD